MAYGMYGYAGLVCPIMDARRNQVYTGIYDNREGFTAVREQCAMDIDELVDELNNMETRVVFLGDGVPVYRERIAERITVPCEFAPAHVKPAEGGGSRGSGLYSLSGRAAETAGGARAGLLKKAAGGAGTGSRTDLTESGQGERLCLEK